MFDHFKTSMLWWLYCMLVRKAAPTVQGKVETRPDFQEHRGKKSPLLQVVVVWCGHVPVRNTEIR